jgi:membrane protease YdiL (CAAX protease family)
MLQRAFRPSPLAVVGVALAFSFYHLDPHHVLATVPAGLYFGWLAARTGSTVAPIVAHVCNNTLALLQSRFELLHFGYGTEHPIPVWWMGATTVITTASVVAIVRATRAGPGEESEKP